jgi:tetratricopeptide (TPR) repeat protein
MNVTNPISGLMTRVCGLKVIALLAVGLKCYAGPSFYPTDYFRSPEFRDAFLGTLGVKSDVEPKLTEEEQHYLEQIQPFMGKDLEACINAFEKVSGPEATARFDYELGVLYMQKNDVEKAREALIRAVTKFERFLRAHSNLGLLYTRVNRTREAIPHITKSIALGQASEELYGMLAYCHLQNGDSLSAETAYRNAIMLGPKTVDWKTGLAQALFSQQKAGEAIALLDELLKVDPQKELFWNMQAVAQIANGQPLKAAQNLEMLALMGKATAKEYSILGDIYMSQALFPLASRSYIAGASAKGAPSAPDGLLKNAESLAQRSAYPEAKSVLASVESVFPSLDTSHKVKMLKIRSRIAMAEEAPDSAVALLNEIVQVDPMDGEALMLLADHFIKKGTDADLVQAIFYLERGVKIPTSEADASVRLAQAKIAKSASETDKGKRLEAMASAIELLKRAQELKKRDSVGSYMADLEKTVQKLRSR